MRMLHGKILGNRQWPEMEGKELKDGEQVNVTLAHIISYWVHQCEEPYIG